MSSSEQRRLATASIEGIADRYAQHKATDMPEALQQIDAVLDGIHRQDHTVVLTEAAARYARPTELDWWYTDAFELLVQAGADPQAARDIRDSRPDVKGLGGLGERA